MGLLLLALLLFSAWTCRASLDNPCNILSTKSPTLRLKRHLFCEYDTTVRPVLAKDTAVNVTVTIIPILMSFADQKSSFDLHTWMNIGWLDQHLTWNPEDFDGVTEIRVKSSEIWVPDFALYNSADMSTSQTGVPETLCLLHNNGKVTCVPAIKYKSLCESDFTYWPYDKQLCTLRMGSWTHTGEEISINFKNSTAIEMSNYIENMEWKIMNYTAKKKSPKYSCCPNETFPNLVLGFELQRHPVMLHAAFVTPAVVLMVITLTVLWLDSRSVERISLAALNFICHLMCIQDLNWMIPSNGSTGSPHILLFYRDSLILATFAMLVTAILRKLQATRLTAPSWIVSTVSMISSNRAGRLLLLSEGKRLIGDAEDTATDKPTVANDSWRKLALIVEWLALIVTAFTYAMLVLLLVPMGEHWK